MRISHLHSVSACELAIFIGSHYLQYLRLFDLLMCVVGGLFAIFSLCLCQLVRHLYVAFRSRANFLDS